MARNLLWTIPGNIVGGGIVVGLGYAWITDGRQRAAARQPSEVPAAVAVARD